MTMYKDCYETTVGIALNVKPIIIAIRESIIKDSLGFINLRVKDVNGLKPVFITGQTNSENQIPLFTHPITIKASQSEQYICADVRFFVRKDTPLDNIEKSIKNVVEYNFTKSRLILSMLWQAGYENKIKNNLQFAGIVYAQLISESIAKNYALDFGDQSTLTVITHFFYQSLFSEQNVFSAEDKDRMIIQTVNATKLPAASVIAIFDKIGKLDNVNDYCHAVTEILQNVRLKNFNFAVLLTIIKNSWYGTNAKEIIAVSLEHPPTWCAIVWTALNERSYKNSSVYRIAERFGKRGGADEFNSNYTAMIKEYIQPEVTQSTVAYRDYN